MSLIASVKTLSPNKVTLTDSGVHPKPHQTTVWDRAEGGTRTACLGRALFWRRHAVCLLSSGLFPPVPVQNRSPSVREEEREGDASGPHGPPTRCP